ncbi:MAG: thioesterase family protein [Ignavibacteriaceae bacterium]|nr:thioesterase family protein [Ignavibacteriaceae bacterium]
MTDIRKFKHKITITVRFNEVDMLGVCNNSVYFVYFDEAKFKYIKEIGLMPEGGWFRDGSLFFVVRNEINYRDFARFDDELNIYTRISFMKYSSFGFEHIVENAKTKQIIAEGSVVLVHVDPKTHKSAPLPEKYFDLVRLYEKDVAIIS